MTALDWIFLVVLVASLLLGAWRGLVYETLSVVSWIAAFFVAQWYAPAVANMLPMSGAAEGIRYAAGFAVVFIAVVFAGGMVAWLVKKLIESSGLRPADRALGAVFGALRGVVVLLAATVVVTMTPLSAAAWWTESVGANLSHVALKGLKPVLPEAFGKYIP